MMNLAKATRATVIPCIRYRNERRALDWLHDAFGFEKHLVVPRDNGGIAHAELSFGNGMMMLGSLPGSEFSLYVVVEDADALYERAKAAGAEIVRELKDEDYGGRGFSCRDLEGHTWSFGTYDPW